MRKKRRLRNIVLIFAISGVLAYFSVRWFVPKEPLFAGEPVSWWLRHPEGDRTKGFPLMETDSNAMPYLIKELGTRDTAWQRFYLSAWYKMPVSVRTRLPQPTGADRIRLLAFSVLSCSRKTIAGPALIKAMNEDDNRDVRRLAAEALGTVGRNDPNARQALVRASQSTDRDLASVATQSLAEIDRYRAVDQEAVAEAGLK